MIDPNLRRRVLIVFGTRPEAIKLAPLVLHLELSPDFEPVVVVTAQHREMLDQVLETFHIAPAHDLDVGCQRQTLTDITVRTLERLAPVIAEVAPDAVLVQGDTTTAFAGALAAFYQRVPVVHLEAGLRTGDPDSPYPEEVNRRLISAVASLHFAPTHRAKANLMAERVDESRIVVTGNTVIDALLWIARVTLGPHDVLAGVGKGPIVLVTAHRRESWGPRLQAIGRAIQAIARAEPGTQIVFPLHKNPVVREAVTPYLYGLPNVRLLEPLPYPAFVRLMQRCRLILTDSGGIQEEAPSLGKPVLVMRDTTERPEAVAAGGARLVGTDEHAITAAVGALLHDEAAYRAMANTVNPFGDGLASQRAVQALRHLLASGSRPADFDPVVRARRLVEPDVEPLQLLVTT